jgi:hypothetical protein
VNFYLNIDYPRLDNGLEKRGEAGERVRKYFRQWAEDHDLKLGSTTY